MTRITGNKVDFIFENIDLPPSENNVGGGNTIGGHGNVLFKIRSRENLNAGDMVANMANIYFDYNFPVATNTANTVFALLSKTVFEEDKSVSVYPNPTMGIININATDKITSLQLFDLQGRILQTSATDINKVSLDISDRQKGVYFLKVTTEKGASVQKIIKE